MQNIARATKPVQFSKFLFTSHFRTGIHFRLRLEKMVLGGMNTLHSNDMLPKI